MVGFDWVKARSKCSLESVFQTLREVLDSDVKSVNGLNRVGVTFALNNSATNKLIISRERDYGGLSGGETVVFELLPNEIRVRDGRTEKHFFSAKPVLNQEGECLLEVTGELEPQRLWQVSRKALDDLFFGF
jgi:hypothetical protein